MSTAYRHHLLRGHREVFSRPGADRLFRERLRAPEAHGSLDPQDMDHEIIATHTADQSLGHRRLPRTALHAA